MPDLRSLVMYGIPDVVYRGLEVVKPTIEIGDGASGLIQVYVVDLAVNVP